MAISVCGVAVLVVATAGAALLPVTADAALVGRDINGYPVATAAPSCVFVYDTDRNVTWLRDWSYATTSGFTASALGRLPWGAVTDTPANQTAHGYAAYLNGLNGCTGYGGFTGWRLPTADLTVPNAGAFNATSGEIGHLWYVELGNAASPGVSNPGPFVNMNTTNVNLASWTDDVYAADASMAWNFRTSQGFQFHDNKGNTFQTPAVRTGDVLAKLQGRDINGFPVPTNAPNCVFLYETDRDLTWIRDWSSAGTRGYTANGQGRLPWGAASDQAGAPTANGYIAFLNYGSGYGSVTGWRLPTADLTVPSAGAFNATNGEIGHLWYVTLGNAASPGTSNPGPFLNMNTTSVNLASWTSALYVPDPTMAWNFRTSQGYQFHDNLGNLFQTPTVRTGDITIVAGACCNRWNGTCIVEIQATCSAHGLRFDGLGSVCSAATCKNCPADFNGTDGSTVSDIFAFLTAWFAGCP